MQTADVQEINRVLNTFPDRVPVAANERREESRFAFVSQQAVAPYSGTDMPRAADFRNVPCHDISAGGMAFYWDRQIDFDYVVVALETGTASMRVIGRTTYCVAEGDRNYRIGCQFVKRLK